jgi:hypothetical protein
MDAPDDILLHCNTKPIRHLAALQYEAYNQAVFSLLMYLKETASRRSLARPFTASNAVISLHNQLLTASALVHRSSLMQCNAGARKPALLRFRIQDKNVAGGCAANPLGHDQQLIIACCRC